MNTLAARFGLDGSTWTLITRFLGGLFDGRIDSLDCAVYAAIFLGITCGALGSFIVLRRQSLLGDAIGHSVLPGVCLGFLAAGGRSIPMLLLGALISGLLSALLIALIQRTTKLKTGECMGLVFTGFYGLGIVLLKIVQRRSLPGSSGLDKLILGGQIAAISLLDTILIGAVMLFAIAMIVIFWRPLSVSSFDEEFAQGLGIPVRWIHYLLMVLLTVAIVISIQAVGVVLVSAMLVIPAATGYLLTDRLKRMVLLSACFGSLGGVTGAFFSYLDKDAPSGAFMVLAAALLFALAFFLAPRHGLLPRLKRRYDQRRRTAAENLLKTLYIMREHRGTDDPRFGVHDVAAMRHEPPEAIHRLRRIAARRDWVDPTSPDPIILTPQGLEEARRIVRNHRLWELFLTQEANLASDHVHADAEYIEHVLPKDVLRKLEQMLDSPAADPHGRPIPAGGAA
jgi:ABC-type Mn2+/Zn2+ transport system permease subunit/Mn-dependent DtxR family transcriptional regulator